MIIYNQPNNILSYFIKDIKDAQELDFYRQINYFNNSHIKIKYKDKILYEIQGIYCYNHINNVVKGPSLRYMWNCKIYYSFSYNYKNLYYKKDRLIRSMNRNFIGYHFTYNKYLKKLDFEYFINSNKLLYISIIYYKKYKYIRKYKGYKLSKFPSFIILIPNKYELHYYCKFFNLYFGNN